MFIIENFNNQVNRYYCIFTESIWDPASKKYIKPKTHIGHLDASKKNFVPNKYLSSILEKEEDGADLSDMEKVLLERVREKYGDVKPAKKQERRKAAITAESIKCGPLIIFGHIASQLKLDSILTSVFGEKDANMLMSLSWYLALCGGALGNNELWLNNYAVPSGGGISSQDVSRLLGRISKDNIFTFQKLWLNEMKKIGDKELFDSTSISCFGSSLGLASYGKNKDNDSAPQINYALLCSRKTGMPLFAWLLEGSITDVVIIKTLVSYLNNLGYFPNCLIMDRGFPSMDNISELLRSKIAFLQALKNNSDWLLKVIDFSREERKSPLSIVQTEKRTYYGSTTECMWVELRKPTKNGFIKEHYVHICRQPKEKYVPSDNETVVSQYPCYIHILFSQDLVGHQKDKLMLKLKEEYERLTSDKNALPPKELEKYFMISKEKYARNRTIRFNLANIEKQIENYAGNLCLITNDKKLSNFSNALKEYSTRDRIEKDFDEMKNDQGMNRPRSKSIDNLEARLLVIFLSEIFIRKIKCHKNNSQGLRFIQFSRLKAQISNLEVDIFVENSKLVPHPLTNIQRALLESLDIDTNNWHCNLVELLKAYKYR